MRVGGLGREQEAVERVKKVITEGRLQRKWHRGKTDDRFFFFFSFCSRAFSDTHTHTLSCQSSLPVCGYFQSLLLLPLGAHRPPPLFALSSLLYSFSPVLSFHPPASSTELWLGNTERQWSNLIPIHWLQSSSPPHARASTSLSTAPAASALHLFCFTHFV